MIASVSQLANMEMALYGGFGSNMNAPSYLNGYTGSIQNIYNSPANIFGNTYNPTFGQNIPQGYDSYNGQQQTSNPTFNQGAFNALADCYAKNELSLTQSFGTAVVSGGILGTLMQNPRAVFHPINYITTTAGKNKKLYDGIKNGYQGVNKLFDLRGDNNKLKELWKNHSSIMEEAYSQMHRAEARANSKLGLFRAKYTTDEFKKLSDEMMKALKGKNIKEIAEATEKLRAANDCKNGKIFQAWNWIKNGFKNGKVGLKNPLNESEKDLANRTQKALKSWGYETGKKGLNLNIAKPKMTISKSFMKKGGLMGLAFGLIQVALEWGKVSTAKKKDAENAQAGVKTNYGGEQTKQTLLKAGANTIGWAIGETLGTWGFAKLGAKIGTAFGPGVGTAVGAAIGFVCGSIGSWLADKASKKALGDDVANKIQAENLAKTEEGQAQLLQYTVDRIQNGKEITPEAQVAIQQLMAQYA